MNINTGLPLHFLLIKLTPLISISSVTEMSVFLRRLYSTDWFLIVFAWRAKKTSECEANVCARLFPECDYILAVWFGVRKVASADNLQFSIVHRQKFVTRFARNWNSSRLSSILREFCGNQTCEQPTCSSFVLFSCFSPSGFKYFRTLVADVSATNFLGLCFLRKYMLPFAVLIKSFLLCGQHI